MGLEQGQWEMLDRHQTQLMLGRVAASSQCMFGKAAQQAGIGLLNATRFTVTMEDRTYDAVTWPDSNMPRTTCFVAANDKLSSDEPYAFARVSEHPEKSLYIVEGVGLNLAHTKQGLYSTGRQAYNTMGEDTSAAAAGLAFFSSSLRAARAKEHVTTYRPPGAATKIGMRGDKIGSLVSSLITLDANLVFGLAIMNQPGNLTDRTYDQAQAMLKKIISDSVSGKESSGTVLNGANGQPYGALFASDDHGIMVIRRINTYPQTIAFTLARQLSRDLGCTVEHYLIQPRGVYTNVSTLQPDNFNGQSLLSMLPSLDTALTEDASRRIYLDATGLDALDLKLVKVLSSRIIQPV